MFAKNFMRHYLFIDLAPCLLIFISYLEPHSLLHHFANGNILRTPSRGTQYLPRTFEVDTHESAAALGAKKIGFATSICYCLRIDYVVLFVNLNNDFILF